MTTRTEDPGHAGSSAAVWGVEVNETALVMRGGPTWDWWAVYRHWILARAKVPIVIVESGTFGDLIFIPRDGRKSATWLRELAISKGAQKDAFAVRRRPSLVGLRVEGETK